jgi:hypothetical protein
MLAQAIEHGRDAAMIDGRLFRLSHRRYSDFAVQFFRSASVDEPQRSGVTPLFAEMARLMGDGRLVPCLARGIGRETDVAASRRADHLRRIEDHHS